MFLIFLKKFFSDVESNRISFIRASNVNKRERHWVRCELFNKKREKRKKNSYVLVELCVLNVLWP